MLHTSRPPADGSVRDLRQRFLERSRTDAPVSNDNFSGTGRSWNAIAARLLRSRWTILIALPLVAALATILIALVVPPSYTVKGTLLVTFSRDYVYRPMVGTTETILPWRPETIVNSELEILNSDDMKRRVVDRIGADRIAGRSEMENRRGEADARQVAKAMEALRSGLILKSVKDSNIIHIHFRHSDPDLAVEIVNQLIASYMARRSEIFGTQYVGFLEQKVAERERAFDAAVRSQQQYKRDLGLVRHEEERAALQQREASLLTERDRLERVIVEAEGERKVVEPLGGSGSQRLGQIEVRIASSKAALAEIELRLKTISDRLLELEASKGALDSLASRIAFEQTRLDQARARLDEAKVNEALDRSELSNVKLVESPHRPDRKDGLPLTTRVGVALLIGFLAALGLLAFLGRLTSQAAAADDMRPPRAPTVV